MVTEVRVVVLWVDIAWKGACENILVVIFLLLEILIYLLYRSVYHDLGSDHKGDSELKLCEFYSM